MCRPFSNDDASSVKGLVVPCFLPIGFTTSLLKFALLINVSSTASAFINSFLNFSIVFSAPLSSSFLTLAVFGLTDSSLAFNLNASKLLNFSCLIARLSLYFLDCLDDKPGYI